MRQDQKEGRSFGPGSFFGILLWLLLLFLAFTAAGLWVSGADLAETLQTLIDGVAALL